MYNSGEGRPVAKSSEGPFPRAFQRFPWLLDPKTIESGTGTKEMSARQGCEQRGKRERKSGSKGSSRGLVWFFYDSKLEARFDCFFLVSLLEPWPTARRPTTITRRDFCDRMPRVHASLNKRISRVNDRGCIDEKLTVEK